MGKALLANPRTGVVGVAVIGVTVAFIMGRVDLHSYLSVLGLLAGGGFVLSHDAKEGK